ncbi:hypothetical protein E3J79_04500 [Candidatus Dependentiae bacterium]|nr:MAG: hypothetical protein E3J79_04500 [Candidatus Dependentiae bacterium]
MIYSILWYYKNLLYVIISFVMLSCFITYPMDEWDIFADDPAIDQFLEQHEFSMVRQIKPEEILTILIDGLNILDILKEDLYCKTYPLNTRSLLDLPFVRPYHWHNKWDRKIGVQPFYNQTNRMFFTKKCDALSSYLAICNPNLLRKLSEALSQDMIREEFPDFKLDPICIFPLFRNMTVQERRAGLMISGSRRWRWVTFRAFAPIYYLERNFFLTNEERRKAEAVFGAPSDTSFQDNHLISDKLGIGDTRFIVAFHVIRRENCVINLGFQTTIPTAFAFKKGLKGSSFEQWKKIRHCRFSIETLWDLAQKDVKSATEYGTDFFLGVLDTLAANLLDVELGNNKHPGIGFFMQTKNRLSFLFKRPWAHSIKYKGTVSLEYLLPKTERRFFLIKTCPEELDKDLYNSDQAEIDPEYALQWLTLIEETFTNKFYPAALDTRVQPGIIFQWTSNFFYETGPWRFLLGTDWWIQGPTSLESLEVPSDIGALRIDLKKAEPCYAFQSKICGGIFYTFKQLRRNWNLSLYGDYTYWSSGIGNDFTVAFNFEVDF